MNKTSKKAETAAAAPAVKAESQPAKKTSRPKTAARPEPVMYIGPKTLGLATASIFTGELPPQLTQAMEDFPIIKNLVVPVSKLAAANIALSNPDSALRRFYTATENYFKGR